ncbi:hypothetical protein SAY86_022583 [Trapa natans]|uniref:Glycosyltransferase n=1 Tax=Trapa natans TaxID=22666 RepID=A0AAN7LNN1_TRANT|nr:hypothetical protein SAY86_022583 [Trapa natans]
MSSPRPRKHVRVFVFTFASHTAAMLTLVRKVAAPAPDVLFSFFGTKTFNGQVLPEEAVGVCGNVRSCYVGDGLPEGFVPSGNPFELIDLFLKAVQTNFYEAMEGAEKAVGVKICCLITDAFLWFGAEMAQEKAVPWVPVWFSGSRSLLTHVHTDLIRETLGSQEPEDSDKMLDFIPCLESVRSKDLPWEVIRMNPTLQFSIMVDKMARSLPKANAVVVNSFDELDPFATSQLEKHFKKVLNVDPISVLSTRTETVAEAPPPPTADPHGCIQWLNEQPPASVVYISFGSVITPLPGEVTALAEALDEAAVPFLWSFRGDPKEHLPSEFVARSTTAEGCLDSKSKMVPWAPQLEVLRHGSVGAFLTHCGWNSLLECFTGGVPAIMRPFFGDQKMNYRYMVSVMRVGIGLEGGEITKAGVVAALRRVLLENEGKKMRGRMGPLKEIVASAVAAAAALVRTSSLSWRWSLSRWMHAMYDRASVSWIILLKEIKVGEYFSACKVYAQVA